MQTQDSGRTSVPSLVTAAAFSGGLAPSTLSDLQLAVQGTWFFPHRWLELSGWDGWGKQVTLLGAAWL